MAGTPNGPTFRSSATWTRTGRASPGPRPPPRRSPSGRSGSSKACRSDKYYLYGKLQLYIDTITFQGAWIRKFGWKGELLAHPPGDGWIPIAFTRPNGKVDYNQGSNQAFQCVENLKLNRATVAGIKSSPTARSRRASSSIQALSSRTPWPGRGNSYERRRKRTGKSFRPRMMKLPM